MHKIPIKRVTYYSPATGKTYDSGVEYDGRLTDSNILGAMHEVGKTAWIGNNLWMLDGNQPKLRVNIILVYQYEKSWYNLLFDALRRL